MESADVAESSTNAYLGPPSRPRYRRGAISLSGMPSAPPFQWSRAHPFQSLAVTEMLSPFEGVGPRDAVPIKRTAVSLSPPSVSVQLPRQSPQQHHRVPFNTVNYRESFSSSIPSAPGSLYDGSPAFSDVSLPSEPQEMTSIRQNFSLCNKELHVYPQQQHQQHERPTIQQQQFSSLPLFRIESMTEVLPQEWSTQPSSSMLLPTNEKSWSPRSQQLILPSSQQSYGQFQTQPINDNFLGFDPCTSPTSQTFDLLTIGIPATNVWPSSSSEVMLSKSRSNSTVGPLRRQRSTASLVPEQAGTAFHQDRPSPYGQTTAKLRERRSTMDIRQSGPLQRVARGSSTSTKSSFSSASVELVLTAPQSDGLTTLTSPDSSSTMKQKTSMLSVQAAAAGGDKLPLKTPTKVLVYQARVRQQRAALRDVLSDLIEGLESVQQQQQLSETKFAIGLQDLLNTHQAAAEEVQTSCSLNIGLGLAEEEHDDSGPFAYTKSALFGEHLQPIERPRALSSPAHPTMLHSNLDQRRASGLPSTTRPTTSSMEGSSADQRRKQKNLYKQRLRGEELYRVAFLAGLTRLISDVSMSQVRHQSDALLLDLILKTLTTHRSQWELLMAAEKRLTSASNVTKGAKRQSEAGLDEVASSGGGVSGLEGGSIAGLFGFLPVTTG